MIEKIIGHWFNAIMAKATIKWPIMGRGQRPSESLFVRRVLLTFVTNIAVLILGFASDVITAVTRELRAVGCQP